MLACEKDDPPDDDPKEETCKNIAEDKTEIWSKTSGQPIDLTDLISTYKGADNQDYVRCRFILEVDDVCTDHPASIEVKYQLESTFPADYDYRITDMKLEALFWEYQWDSVKNERDEEHKTIPISFLGNGAGSASGEFDVTAPYKADELYANIGASIEFVLRVKDPQKPNDPVEVFKSIISSVEIGVSYKR
jgi:hypothetical protein